MSVMMQCECLGKYERIEMIAAKMWDVVVVEGYGLIVVGECMHYALVVAAGRMPTKR